MPIILSCSGALRALIVGGSLYPGLRRTTCSSPGVMFVSPSGLGRRLVRIVVCWLFESDAYLKSMLDSTWKKHIQNEKSANAISQRLSSLNILIPTIDSDNFWELYPVFQKSFSHISDKTKESEIDRKLSAKNKRQS